MDAGFAEPSVLILTSPSSGSKRVAATGLKRLEAYPWPG